MQDLQEFAFWENKVVYNADELITNPELLWRSASDYFTESMQRPLTGFGYNERTMSRVQPFTMTALCLYLDRPHDWLEKLENNLSYKNYEDFTGAEKKLFKVLHRIKNTIDQHKYICTAAGLLNMRFIALDMGMYGKKENGELVRFR